MPGFVVEQKALALAISYDTREGRIALRTRADEATDCRAP